MNDRIIVTPFISPFNLRATPSERKDQFGFYLVSLILILLPLERVILPFSLKPVDFVLLLTTMYGVFVIFVSDRRIYFPLIIPSWLILIASLVATLTGVDHSASLTAISQEIYLYLWFLILTNLLSSFSVKDIDRILKTWTIIAVAQAIFTIMGMFTIGPAMFFTSPENVVLMSYSGLARGLGTFVNPNATGAYLSISFFLSLGTSWHKWLRYTFAFVIFAGMYGSGSLGAISATLFGVLALTLMTLSLNSPSRTDHRGRLLGLAAALLILASLLIVYFTVISSSIPLATDQKWVATTIGRLPRSISSRQELLSQAWLAYKSNPWGIGPNASQLLLGTIHNDYAAFLIERGLLGLTGWLFLVGSCLYYPFASVKKEQHTSIRFPLLTMISAFLACAIFAFTHEISHFRQFWMLLALVFAFNYIVETKRASARSY